MSQRHDDALALVRREYDDVVAALTMSNKSSKRGAPGVPAYDPARLDAAIEAAGDAYALLLIATAEAFLRDFLISVGIDVGDEPKLSMLIDKSVKEFNKSTTGTRIRPDEKIPFHDLRVARNTYAHGHARNVFPTVAKVQAMLAKFLHPFP